MQWFQILRWQKRLIGYSLGQIITMKGDCILCRIDRDLATDSCCVRIPIHSACVPWQDPPLTTVPSRSTVCWVPITAAAKVFQSFRLQDSATWKLNAMKPCNSTPGLKKMQSMVGSLKRNSNLCFCFSTSPLLDLRVLAAGSFEEVRKTMKECIYWRRRDRNHV